jgi:hypothetical protein
MMNLRNRLDFNLIIERQNSTTIKTFYNSIKESYIKLMDKFSLDTYDKKICAKLDADYEDNKDYFRLVELIMDKNCCGCKRCGAECDIYKEFESHCVPAPRDEAECNCKYAYKPYKAR